MYEEIEPFEPYLEILRRGPARLVDELIRITTELGNDGSWEHAMVIYFFRGIGDCQEIFDEFVRPELGEREGEIFLAGLYSCFHPELLTEEEYLEMTAETLHERWQTVTRNLLQIDVHAEHAWSWLYGWARYGVYIYGFQQRPRNNVWALPHVSNGASQRIERHLGWDSYLDELPPSLDALARAIRDVQIGRAHV